MPVTTTRNGGFITVEFTGADEVREALGDLKNKAPAVLKVAANQTARQARKWMIAAALARYAVNAAGERELRDLKQTKKATNRSPSATLFISKMRADLGYFENVPSDAYTGQDVFTHSPEFYRARVLLSSELKELKAGPAVTNRGVRYEGSKAFLVQFQNGHIGMVRRMLGSSSERRTTEAGKRRWTNKAGNVEKLITVGAPSGSAMLGMVWDEVADDVANYLQERVTERIQWNIEWAARRAAQKAGR